ncbi:MAG: hypothetical protein WAZ48_06640 [Lysobacteraceae bacterium]
MTDTQTLTSLAMLKVDIDTQHRTYVDYLTPFLLDVLNLHKDDIISDTRIADRLLKKYGLQIPTKVVHQALRRLQKKNYLHINDGVFTVSSSLPTSSLSTARAAATTHIDSVLNALVVEALAHKLIWTKEDANKAAVSFLGKFTVDCLRTYVFNTALPDLPPSKSSEQYIVSKFIKNSKERSDPAFESFIVLVKGLMYSNALLCPDLESLEKKFQDVTFYIDTPLVLNLLGLQDEGSKRSAEELIGLLIKLKGTVAVFVHTLQECQNIIGYAFNNIDNSRATSRVLEEIRRSNAKLSDLILARENIDAAVRKHGVKVKNSPEYLHDFQIDEIQLEDSITDSKPNISEAAVLHDINSIRSIFVLRKGRQPVRLEDSGAVFVTLNASLARAAYRIGKDHNSSREVSPAVTAYSLANIAWLKSPVAAPSLPLYETMALSYAALEPSTDLFKKYVLEMDRLLAAGQISTHDHEILRLSPSARNELMELTLGDEQALTASSIKSILSNARTAIVAEQQSTYSQQIAAQLSEAANEVHSLQQRENDALDRAFSAESQYEELNRKLERLSDFSERQHNLRMKRHQQIATAFTRVAILLPILILLFGSLAGASLLTPQANASVLIKTIFPVSALIAVAWGVYSWYTGATVRALENRIIKLIANLLSRLLDPNEA